MLDAPRRQFAGRAAQLCEILAEKREHRRRYVEVGRRQKLHEQLDEVVERLFGRLLALDRHAAGTVAEVARATQRVVRLAQFDAHSVDNGAEARQERRLARRARLAQRRVHVFAGGHRVGGEHFEHSRFEA